MYTMYIYMYITLIYKCMYMFIYVHVHTCTCTCYMLYVPSYFDGCSVGFPLKVIVNTPLARPK